MEHAHPLKAFRASSKLTQTELAHKLGVTRTTVARWESGARKIGEDLLPLVARTTGISKDVLRPDLARLMEAAE